MRFCENCGAKLDDNAVFCDECGTNQNQQQEEHDSKPKEKSKTVVYIVIILVLILGLLGGGTYYVITQNPKSKADTTVKTQEKVEAENAKKEAKSIKEAIKWQDNSEKVKAFKKLSIAPYPDTQIGKALSDDYSVISWKYGEENKEEYWLCNYTHEEAEYTLVFYEDSHGNINIVEYYIEDEPQSKDVIKEITEQIFSGEDADIKEDHTESKFVLKDSCTYTANDSSVVSSLTVTVSNDNQIQVDINLANHTYDLTYYGEIITPNTAQFTLDAGEKINLVWNNEDELIAAPVNGFSDESISTMRMLCNALNNKTYVADEEAGSSPQVPPFKAVYMPADGFYINSTNGGLAHTCEIRINKETDNSFKFSIWEVFDENRNSVDNMIFQEHIAVFDTPEATSAVFQGQTYTLYFDCSQYGEIKLSGFENAVQLGNIFYNMAITN